MFALSAFIAQSIQPTSEGGIPGAEGPAQVRFMDGEDSEFVASLLVEGFRTKYERAAGKKKIPGVIKAQTEELQHIREKYNRILVATINDEPAGVLQLQYHGDEFEEDAPYCQEIGCCSTCGLMCMGCVIEEKVSRVDDCYIDCIAVSEEFRGKGIGRLLITRAEFEAKLKDCKTLTLWVAQDNRAKRLYERLGFKVVQEEDGCLITYCTVGVRRWTRMQKTL